MKPVESTSKVDTQPIDQKEMRRRGAKPMRLKVTMDQFDELFDDAADALLAIPGDEKEQKINFLYNLVENGGGKEQAAVKAGYGQDASIPFQSKESIAHNAAIKADELLSIPEVSVALEALMRIKIYTLTISNTCNKEGLITACYFLMRNNITKAPQAAARAIEIIANLKKYYDIPKEFNDALDVIKLILPQMPNRNEMEKLTLKKSGLLAEEVDDIDVNKSLDEIESDDDE